MSAEYPFSIGEYRHRTDVICSIPAGGVGERMAAYGNNFGRGASRLFSGGLVGKTFLVTDTTATSVAQKEIKFLSSNFAKVDAPTLAEIVAALNAAFTADATPTVASAGPQGELVITAAAASGTGGLTIGAGTANILLGFPKSGVYYRALNGTGVDIYFPSGMQDEYLKSHAPHVVVHAYTPATAVRTSDTQFTAVWTPSSRTVRVTNNGGVARVGHIQVEL